MITLVGGTVSIDGVGFFNDAGAFTTTTVTLVSILGAEPSIEITTVTTYYGDISQNIFTSNGTTSQQTLSCSADYVC